MSSPAATETPTTTPTKRRVALYWPIIALLWVLCLAMFGYHLATGVTPDRVAFSLGGIDVYWYGIWIVGGIALGAYVVATIADERGQRIFVKTVPSAVAQLPLSDLALDEETQAHLTRRGFANVGDLLRVWGDDPRGTGLSKEQRADSAEILAADERIDKAWLTDAPWRIWNPDHVWNGIIWCLILGVIGARIYHILTPSPSMAAIGIETPLDYLRNPVQLVNFRSGGLGIYGGIAGGALGLFLYTRRARIPLLPWADLAVVGLALGQTFGRWGNFFNQELYGAPANLPWSIQIEAPYRLPAFANVTHYHPAFLYESLWSFGAFLLLHWLAKHKFGRTLPGEVMALYLILYAVGRTLLELVRLDSRAVSLGGLDVQIAVATLVSIVIALVAAIWVVARRLRRNSAETK